jgi:3-hydroxybutyryl-CoA dehydrogenase
MTQPVRGPVAVLGAGNMGGQIAHQIALHGFDVRLWSRSEERLAAARAESSKLLGRRVEKGKLDAAECEAALARVSTTTDLASAVRGADLVVETISEDRDVKRELCHRLNSLADEDALIATNSSTLPSSFFEGCFERTDRLLNMHFFNPALVMQLVEIVRGPHTSDATVERAMAFARAIGKTPIRVEKECYGFLANRMLFIAMQEAFHLVEEGYVSIEDCDGAVQKALGWPLGPFDLADLVGLDVVEAILREGAQQTGEARWKPRAILSDRVTAGDLGRKNGRGFRTSPEASAAAR